MKNDTTSETLQTDSSDRGAWSLEDQITSLTNQALNGNTIRNRHLALCQLLIKLGGIEEQSERDDLLASARDAAIKHAGGVSDIVAALLVNSPLPEASNFDHAAVLPVHTNEYVDEGNVESPEDVSIGTIAEHMAHYPDWENRLLEARAKIGPRDPQDIKSRAIRITDDLGGETYSATTREIVQRAYDGGDLDLLADAVRLAEAGALSVGNVQVDDPRIAELEAEVDLWKRQPWDLTHSEPRGRPGRRRGESEVDEILDELQIKVILEHIGENTTGPAVTGAILLLCEYLGRLAFDKRFNDLDMAIDDIRAGLLAGDYMKDHGAESLRLYTIERVHDWITFKVTSDMQRLTEAFQKYHDRRERG